MNGKLQRLQEQEERVSPSPSFDSMEQNVEKKKKKKSIDKINLTEYQ